MKVSKWMVLVVCLVAFSVLIAGCGKKTPSTKDPGKDPTPDPPQETQLELNAGEELAALQALSLPGTHKGFTFGERIVFDTNTKTYDGVEYTGRIKLGGSDPVARGISFTAKKDDTHPASSSCRPLRAQRFRRPVPRHPPGSCFQTSRRARRSGGTARRT